MALQANFKGTILTQPGSASFINATALNTIQLGFSGTVAVVGTCQSGQPKTPLTFTSPGQLKSALGSGNAYDAARAVFTPSTQIVEGNPVRVQKVIVVRVDPATQSTLTLNDAVAASSLTFTSQDWGAQTNQITVTVANSTNTQPLTAPTNDGSKKVTIYSSFTKSTEVYDNLGVNPVLSVIYTGNGTSATLTTTATQMTTVISGQTDGSTSLTIPYATFPTIQNIADFINSQTGYTATIQTTQPTVYQAVNLDYVATQNIKTPAQVNLYGVINEIVNAINSVSAIVTVLRAAPGNLPPTNIAATAMTGGSTPAATTNDWQNSANALNAVRVNFVVPTTTSSSLTPIFAAFGDASQGKNECHVHVGLPLGQTLTQLTVNGVGNINAATFNDVNVSAWFQQVFFPNDQGVSTLYDTWMTAALAAGLQGGMPPGSSFVNKSLNILGVKQDSSIDLFNNADQLILAHLAFIRFSQQTSSFNVVRAITTYSQDSIDYHIETGLRSAVNYAIWEIRNDIQNKFLGSRTLFTEAGSTASSIARELVAFGAALEAANIIVKATVSQNGQNTTLPALVVDSVTINGDTATLNYGFRPIGAINFLFHSVTLQSIQQISNS